MKNYHLLTLLRIGSASIVILLCLHSLSYSKPRVEREDFLEKLEYDQAFFEKKRDPIFAGMLSWYMPGLGQFYSGEILKGTFFLVTEYSLTIGAIFYFLNFDFAAGEGSGFRINVDDKRADLGVVKTSRRNVFIGIMSLVLVIHLFNVADAVYSARNYNVELERKRLELRKKYPTLKIGCDDKRSFYIGLETYF
jgi:hypothetical protein